MLLQETLRQTLQVTAFVAAMMIGVEYLNVLSRGAWRGLLAASPARQYLLAVVLGATPGCLGAFAVVALYSHRVVSFGAVVACMIATSGDEAFVMLALFPSKALALAVGLALLGWLVGMATDALMPGTANRACRELVLHDEQTCQCFARGQLVQQLRHLRPARGVLAVGMGLTLLSLLSGLIGPSEWNWLKWTLLGVAAGSTFVVLTVPEHFLEEHLWQHTALKHLPRVFCWTFAALGAVALLSQSTPQLSAPLREGRWLTLGLACLLGIVPESGPHLLFVTLHAKALVPLSTLVASSIVQDGHGMLPLLADSRLDFLKVKAVNLLAGGLVGGAMMALGW